MNLKELRDLSKKDLETEKTKLDKEIFKLQQERWQKKLKDTNALRNKRKEIAIVLTVLREKEILREISG